MGVIVNALGCLGGGDDDNGNPAGLVLGKNRLRILFCLRLASAGS